MDLKKFYNENINESDYHYRFLESINSTMRHYNIFNGYEEIDYVPFEVLTKRKLLRSLRSYVNQT